MTVDLDIANRALQLAGARTNMTQAEFTGQTSNEAIQSQLIMFKLRDELNRMAPWDCTTLYTNLVYISSLPGTPENPNSGPPLWQTGLPAPPWAYEYQYPVDCMRARAIIPQYTTQSGGIPIFPAGTVTGASTIGWTGPALKFKVATDNFTSVASAAPAVAGSGYSVNDVLTLPQPTFNLTQGGTTYPMPVGASAILIVSSINGSGGITGLTVYSNVNDTPASAPIGGSYFAPTTNPVAVSGGTGVGASVNLTFNSGTPPQRVILCNQEQAILCYNTQITDPNIMDPLFQDAWIHILGARLSFQLNGDKVHANELITLTNNMITEARKADGNEGLLVNDVTPDFLRTRGNFGGPAWEYSPSMQFDWGSFYSPY